MSLEKITKKSGCDFMMNNIKQKVQKILEELENLWLNMSKEMQIIIAFIGLVFVVLFGASSLQKSTTASSHNYKKYLDRKMKLEKSKVAELGDMFKSGSQNLEKSFQSIIANRDLKMAKHTKDTSDLLQKQKLSIESLQGEVEELKKIKISPYKDEVPNNAFGGQNTSDSSANFVADTNTKERFHQITNTEFKLNKKRPFKIHHGYFAGGTVLIGTKANTSTQASADPDKVSIQLDFLGNFPEDMTEGIKEAIISGAAIGDISSKMVKIRLKKMTVVFEDGTVLSGGVQGYVSDLENSIAGVRGKFNDDTGPLITKLGILNAASGFSKFFENLSVSGATKLSNGATVMDMPGREQAKAGSYAGASKAIEKVSEILVKRIENIHPTIELLPGTKVIVVFDSDDAMELKYDPEQTERATGQSKVGVF